MEEMYLIEEIIQNAMGEVDYELDETKILIDEGLFTNEAEAKARCVALARAEFDRSNAEFNQELAEMGFDAPEIDIRGVDGGTYRTTWYDVSHSWRVVSIKVN